MTNELPPADQVCVLVVDDEPDMRELIARLLLQHGHLAVTAETAEEALAALPHYTFQVAFVDHHLPGMEGIVFSEWLRRHNPHMEVALVTGARNQDLEQEALDHAITFIQKPFEVEQILELPGRYVEAALERMERQSESPEQRHPPISEYFEDLDAFFDLPSIPDRIEERLVRRIRDAMTNLHSVSRYTERDRVAALSGLLAAKVLSVRLPRGRRGQTLFEEYDSVMESRGRRREFTE